MDMDLMDLRALPEIELHPHLDCSAPVKEDLRLQPAESSTADLSR